MKTTILDSHALLTYFEKEAGWRQVAALLTEAADEKARLMLAVVNWGEIAYITERTYGRVKAGDVLEAIDQLPIQIAEADRDTALLAARLKAGGGIAYADCFAAGLAQRDNADVATGDPELADVASEVDILWLA